MRYRVKTLLNDGKREDPGVEVEVDGSAIAFDRLMVEAADCLFNDEGIEFPVGSQVIIERIG